MKGSLRKTLEILFLVFVVVLSVVIFLYREKLSSVGSVGYLGLFLLCFAANATVLLPSPSLMIAASAALILNPWAVAAVAALGSCAGEFVGYAFGAVTKEVSPQFRRFLDWLTGKIHNETLLVFVLAALPLPLFDFVGIYSGGIRLNPVKFILACFAGKFLKTLCYTKLYDILEWAAAITGLPVPKEGLWQAS